MLIKVLTGVFDPPPSSLAIPWTYLGTVGGIGLAAVAAAALTTIHSTRRMADSALATSDVRPMAGSRPSTVQVGLVEGAPSLEPSTRGAAGSGRADHTTHPRGRGGRRREGEGGGGRTYQTATSAATTPASHAVPNSHPPAISVSQCAPR